jgi:hypothetical protein
MSYSIYSLPLNQKYIPNTINNTQNNKKPMSNAVLYKLETYLEKYKEQHNYFIDTLLNEPDQNLGYHKSDTITFFMQGKVMKGRWSPI